MEMKLKKNERNLPKRGLHFSPPFTRALDAIWLGYCRRFLLQFCPTDKGNGTGEGLVKSSRTVRFSPFSL